MDDLIDSQYGFNPTLTDGGAKGIAEKTWDAVITEIKRTYRLYPRLTNQQASVDELLERLNTARDAYLNTLFPTTAKGETI